MEQTVPTIASHGTAMTRKRWWLNTREPFYTKYSSSNDFNSHLITCPESDLQSKRTNTHPRLRCGGGQIETDDGFVASLTASQRLFLPIATTVGRPRCRATAKPTSQLLIDWEYVLTNFIIAQINGSRYAPCETWVVQGPGE